MKLLRAVKMVNIYLYIYIFIYTHKILLSSLTDKTTFQNHEIITIRQVLVFGLLLKVSGYGIT